MPSLVSCGRLGHLKPHQPRLLLRSEYDYISSSFVWCYSVIWALK